MKSRAVIIGGSLGGLFAGNLLVDLGWEVDIYERVPDDLASRGAGIGTHQELLSVNIGGSLGGLFAGNLLVDLGWEVDIYERVPDDLASRGAGIGTHQELLS